MYWCTGISVSLSLTNSLSNFLFQLWSDPQLLLDRDIIQNTHILMCVYSPMRIHKSTNRRKKLSLLELELPHKFLNKGRYAKGSNKKSKDAKLVRSSQPSQSSISSSTIRVCNKRFLNKLVESDGEMKQQDEDEEEEYRLLLAEAKETLQMGHKLQIDFGGREDIFLKDFIELEMSNKAKIRMKT